MVVLVMRIVRRISRSTLVGAIAGLLLICDGVSFVTARTALLDGFLTFFVVAAFGALIVDRDQVRERMHIALLEGRIAETIWGPRLGVRWWRFGRGAARIGLRPQSGPACTSWCSSVRCRWRST
jgi:dolichyl-phosphate-mannose-protein mannosyltransferase